MRIVEQGWHRPHDGRVDRWVSLAVVAAVIATFALTNLGFADVAIAGNAMWWIVTGLDVGFVALLIAIALAPSRLSITVRVAFWIPCFHLVAGVIAAIACVTVHVEIDRSSDVAVTALTMPETFAIVTVAVMLGGAVAARRSHEVPRAVASVTLATLLLFGVWLPIALNILRPQDVASCLVILAPPLVVGALYTAISLRRPFLGRVGAEVLAPVGVVVATSYAYVIPVVRDYTSFLPWLIALAVVSIASIIGLAVASYRRPARIDDAIEGTVTSHEVVAGFVLHSWLRGPEPFVEAHEVRTAHGVVRVPSGTRLVSPLPRSTTTTRRGECVPVLAGNARVRLVGFVPVDGGSPFRDAHAVISGEHPEIHLASDEADPRDQLVLAAWRPAVAYLAIVAIVAPFAWLALAHAR